MKKIIIILMVILLMGCQETSVIKDKKLKAKIKEITVEEGFALDEIKNLDASSIGVESLEGIQALTSLEMLTLSNNSIRDITPLGTLEHLTLLDIQNNLIENLEPLKPLEGLQTLFIRNNPVASIEVLEKRFPQYEQTDFLIQASFNDDVLEQVIREQLNRQEGHLSYYDLEKLRVLDLRLHEITDLKGLELAKNLEKLYITGDVKNIDLLSHCINLKELELTHGSLEDLSFLENLSTLVQLDLRYNNIKDVSSLGNLQKLKYLNIKMNQIKDISALDLKSLKILYVAGNPIRDYLRLPVAEQIEETDIHIIYFHDPKLDEAVKAALGKEEGILTRENLKSIKSLEAADLEIENLGGIDLLENLVSLNLSGNNITDLKPLEGIDSLQILNLSDNQLNDITAIAYLSNVNILDLTNNDITTIEALTYLDKLEYLYLSGNAIEPTTLKEEILLKLKGTDEW